MSKAGLILLLALLFLIVSGGATQTFAQEKLTDPTLRTTKTNGTCKTLLENFFVTNRNSCEDKLSSQTDSVVKAKANEKTDNEVNEFSYRTEPTQYIPPTPTTTPTTTPSITIVSSITPDPTTQTPQNNFSASGTNLNSDLIFDMINAHRAQIGKPAFIKDAQLCQLAQIRSTELEGELFGGKGYLHSGLYNRNLPYWITENAKYGSNEAGTVQWWLHSPIHRAAIEGDSVYSCGACSGTQCSQLFTSYIPKAGVKNTSSTTTSMVR